jgi:hypothetical protein
LVVPKDKVGGANWRGSIVVSVAYVIKSAMEEAGRSHCFVSREERNRLSRVDARTYDFVEDDAQADVGPAIARGGSHALANWPRSS